MKHLLILITFLVGLTDNLKAQILEGDSVLIAFGIAHSEFLQSNEGIIFYCHSKTIKAQAFKYQNSIYSLNKDSIIKFYDSNSLKIKIIKNEWVLTESEIDYLSRLINEIKNSHLKSGFSNAPEHYYIRTSNSKFVLINSLGTLKIHKDLKKRFGIEQVQFKRRSIIRNFINRVYSYFCG
jgi:hypothetical protein